MAHTKPERVFIRILLPFLLIMLLQVFPTAHELNENYQFSLRNAEYQQHQSLINNYQTILEYQPWRIELNVEIGHLFYLLENYSNAVEYYQHLDLDQLDTRGQLEMADALLREGKPRQALSVWGQVEDVESELFEKMYQTWLELEEYEEAKQVLSEWQEVEPENALLWYRSGNLLIAQKPLEALENYRQAAQLDIQYEPLIKVLESVEDELQGTPLNNYQLLLIGRALGSAGEWQMAVKVLEETIQLSPDYAEAWAYLGEAKQHIGQDGYPEILKAKELSPQSLSVLTFESAYWRRQGKPEQALLLLYEAAEMDSANPLWELEIGSVLAEMGNIWDALEHYQKAVYLDTLQYENWIALAEFCFQNSMEVQQVGIPAARQAIVLAGFMPEGYDTLGQGMLQVGDYVSAERYFYQALELDAQYAPAHLHLGQLYLIDGQNSKAKEHLRLAVQYSGQDAALKDLADDLFQRLGGE